MSHLGIPIGAEAVYRPTVQPSFEALLRVKGASKQNTDVIAEEQR